MRNRKLTAVFLGTVFALGLIAGGYGAFGETVNAKAKKTEKGEYKEVQIGFPSAGSDWAEGTLALAQEKGYLDEYLHPLGYDAKLTAFTGAAPAIHEALVSQDLDYAYYAGFAGVMAKSNGIDTKLLTVAGYGSAWQLAVTVDSGISTLKDLKGKTISYQRGAAPQMYLLKILEEAGLEEGDVNLVNSTIPEGLSSLSAGAVDGAVVTYGQADTLVEQGKAKILHKGVEADLDTYFEPTVLLGRTEFVEENQEVNVALLKALLKAKDQIVQDPESFYELSSQKSGRTLEQVKSVAVEDPKLGYPVSLDDQYIDSLKKIEKFELKNNLISAKVDFDSWIDASYQKQALEDYQKDTEENQ